MDPSQPAAQAATACELPPSLAPSAAAPRGASLTEVQGAREGLPSTPRGRKAGSLPGGSAESRPAEPRRPHGAGPALPGGGLAAAPAARPLHPHLPRAKTPPFPSGTRGPSRPSPLLPSPASPSSPRPRARLRPAAPLPAQPPPLPAPDGTEMPLPGPPLRSGQVGSGRGDTSGGTRPLPEPRGGGGAPWNRPTPGTAAFGRALWAF